MELSHQAHTYVSAYCPAVADLKKHGILKNLCKNEDIPKIATRQRKWHSSLDRTAYDTGVLNNHHNSRREITTFSQGFKKKGQLDQEVYDAIISEWVTAC